MTFNDLDLGKELLRALNEKGYDKPSPIQQKAIPEILKKSDVLASAQTGTGKTAAFTLPMLRLLNENKPKGKRPIRSMVLTPTRELAAQIQDNVKAYSKYLDLKSAVIFGGVNQKPQVDALNRGIDLLIATPGRLIDLHTQGFVDLDQLEFLVLDEADRMLDMGFIRDIERIMHLLPEKKQTLLFSATFSGSIRALAHRLLKNPAVVETAPKNSTAEMVSQRAIRIDKEEKTNYLIKIISEGEWSQVLVFTRTKHRANRLAKRLDKKGITAAAIHGDKTQNSRTKALADFKAGNVRVLVATDIAARGLDIPLLPHVINFEIPNVPEDYVHRIGRTGRAGASGEAISLVDLGEVGYLKDIEKLMGRKVKTTIEAGFEPTNTEIDLHLEQERKKEEARKRQQRKRRPQGSNKASNQGTGGRSGGRNKAKNSSRGKSGGNSGKPSNKNRSQRRR